MARQVTKDRELRLLEEPKRFIDVLKLVPPDNKKTIAAYRFSMAMVLNN